ncbi:MAG: hypothetical protein JWM41_3513 [Gemmatimonadetes bacterium]|nr:hypothetical protein [Gemmatimonadota bacterium]
MRRRILSTLTITLAVTLFAACDQANPVAPATAVAPPTAASHSLLGTLLGAPKTITPLLRNTPLAANLSASGTVGLLGTAIVIPGAGFSVIVPPLAAPMGTRITVTALAGSKVAYEFAPHGLRFNLPLVATQDLRNTQARNGGLVSPLSLGVGYFPDSTHITTITELLNINVNLLNQTAITTIWHFSGYIITVGEDQ